MLKMIRKYANNLAMNSGFIKNKKGAALKTRFEYLLKTFEIQELDSLRQSCAIEELDEREQLLTDIKQRMG